MNKPPLAATTMRATYGVGDSKSINIKLGALLTARTLSNQMNVVCEAQFAYYNPVSKKFVQLRRLGLVGEGINIANIRIAFRQAIQDTMDNHPFLSIRSIRPASEEWKQSFCECGRQASTVALYGTLLDRKAIPLCDECGIVYAEAYQVSEGGYSQFQI